MNAYLKDLFREIKNTLGRYLSLVIITALGAASVVGIQAASIDMRNIADKTYKEHRLYDLQLKSTVGFDEADLVALRDTEGISAVMPTTIFDVFVSVDDDKRAARTYALPDGINTIQLVHGRLPENPGEVIVDARLLRDGKLDIGGTITLSLDDMDKYFDVLAHWSFTVVGVVASPLYISRERGNTTLGDGSLSYYLYLNPDAYILDVYTDVYLLMDGSHDIDNLTDDYYRAADEWKFSVEQTGMQQVKAKKNELADAQIEIDEGWGSYYDGVDEFEKQSAEGMAKLEEAENELIEAEIKLKDGQQELDEKIADANLKIDQQAKELADGQNELDTRRAELEIWQAQIDVALAQQTAEGLQQLAFQQAMLDESCTALDAAQAVLDNGSRQIEAARKKLETERKTAQDEIDEGWEAYEEGLIEYRDALYTFHTERTEPHLELENARLKLIEAQEKLDDAPTPEWFFFTRKDGLSFDSYYQDTLRLQKIGYVFPLVFFLVAIMVSLTSMSRMVESQRTQIGIYKALGYRPTAIMIKYLFYAFSASLIGGIVGVLVGSTLFPLVITDAYGHMYNMPPIETPIPMLIALTAIISAVLSVLLVTFFTCMGSLVGSPSLLMRPKPPASGKRVLLEKIPFLWNRLNFFGKVTARNIFRYKRRFIMTLAGVAGCSALLVTAFGLSDSIGSVAKMQYGNIVEYDARAYLKEIETEKQRSEITSLLPDAHLFIREEAVTAAGPSDALPASIIIPDRPENLAKFLSLHSPVSWEPIPMQSDSILLTEKLARVMGVSAGDRFTMTYSDGRAFTAYVTGIVDNYIHHHIYMSPDVYKGLFGEELKPNSILIFYENGREFAINLLKNDDVRAVIHNDELLSQLSDATDAMNVVTIVLIVLACALAFVVLFNLTNINISERIRELATIKVLGFNERELAMYIYRENMIVTLLGILLGMIGGIFLHGFVLATAEIDILKFPRIVTLQSYLLSAFLSMIFALFVNFVMNFRLSRIDMVESLKNVE